MKEKIPKPEAIEKVLGLCPQYETLFLNHEQPTESDEPPPLLQQTTSDITDNNNNATDPQKPPESPKRKTTSKRSYQSPKSKSQSKIPTETKLKDNKANLNPSKEQKTNHIPPKSSHRKHSLPEINTQKQNIQHKSFVEYDASEEEIDNEPSQAREVNKRPLSPTIRTTSTKRTNTRKSTENLRRIPTLGYQSKNPNRKS